MIDLGLFQKFIKSKRPKFVPVFKDTSRYQVVYGGAGSGKSHVVARKVLYRILREDDVKHNFLIIRKVSRTIKASTWELMKNLISSWGLTSDFSFNLTDRTMTYNRNGSKLLFLGLDDPEKLKSIEAITSIWCEEATELLQEDFEQLDLRLRGEHGCLLQITLTFNPISAQHWVKRVFFDSGMKDVFISKTTYMDNPYVGDAYVTVMENKKITNPRYYNIYALAEWGTAEGLIFSNVDFRHIEESEIENLVAVQGLDFGYTNDPTAFNLSYVDTDEKIIYVYDGFYEKGMTNKDISKKIKKMKLHKHKTVADSSEPKSIDYIRDKGVKIEGAKKGKDSINIGIDFLLEYRIVVNDTLPEFHKEFLNYSWKKKSATDEKLVNVPIDDFNHFIDSLRYATEQLHVRRSKTFHEAVKNRSRERQKAVAKKRKEREERKIAVQEKPRQEVFSRLV